MLTIQEIDKFYNDVTLLNLRFPVAVISKATGFGKGQVSDYLNKVKSPSENFLKSFYKSFKQSLINVPRETLVSEPKPYYKTRMDIKNGATKGIPIYEAAPVTLTNTVSIRDEKVGDPDFWVTIPNLRDCNYGTRAKGDSMHPLIRTNALVIGKEIVDFKVIIFGEIYIVQTKGGIETVKYIHPHESDSDMILLVPYNEKAKTTPVHKSEILKLYEAKAVFNTI